MCVCACVFQFRSPHLCVKHTLPLVRRHLGLLRFQVISVYWFAALAKLEKDWLDGSALLGILGHRYEMAIVMTYGGESRAGDQSLARSLAHSLFVITIDLLSRLPFPPVAHRPGLFVDSSIPLFLILAMNPRLQRHRPAINLRAICHRRPSPSPRASTDPTFCSSRSGYFHCQCSRAM